MFEMVIMESITKERIHTKKPNQTKNVNFRYYVNEIQIILSDPGMVLSC